MPENQLKDLDFDPKMLIAVFSYNRPKELDNCLTSIRDMVPDPDVLVFDDKSTNPGLPEVFEKHGFKVIHGPGGIGRHGGLYANMQAAYEHAVAHDYDLLLTIQDDMQFVRPLTDEIRNEHREIFASSSAISQIDPRFARLPGSQVRRSENSPSFEWRGEYSQSYSDVGLFKIKRLQAVDWQFNSGEIANRKFATSLGLKRVYPFTPFVMHIPFPPMFRSRLWLPRLSSFRRRIFRFRYMTDAEIIDMDTRPADQPALFRKHLTIENLSAFDRYLLGTKSDGKIF